MNRTSAPTPKHDSKTDLLEAARAVVQDRKVRADQERRAAAMQPQVKKRVSVLLLLSLIGVLLLVLQPAWLAGPTEAPPETPVIQEASLRLSMVRERDHVAAFIRQHGRLPSDLAEAGVSMAGLGYEALPGGAFRLFAQGKDSLLVLGSADSMSTFLGNSLRDLKNRGRP